MSFEHAAAIPVSAQTVWKALFELGNLSSEHTVLIHAAAGGVGHIAVQMAKWKGAKVAGTASGRNQGFLREIGVDIPINYETMVFEEEVRDVDIVFDTIVRDADSSIDIDAKDTRERSWNVLKKGGILVSITGEPDIEKADKLGVRAARLMAGDVIAGDCSKVLDMAGKLYESGHLKPYIFRVFSLEQAQEAHRLSQQGHTRGKIIIKVVT
jgi:NADPH:quinone reductase-like Zn-dependent oxidoreductase